VVAAFQSEAAHTALFDKLKFQWMSRYRRDGKGRGNFKRNNKNILRVLSFFDVTPCILVEAYLRFRRKFCASIFWVEQWTKKVINKIISLSDALAPFSNLLSILKLRQGVLPKQGFHIPEVGVFQFQNKNIIFTCNTLHAY
jgi:hypothetical protein